MTSKDQRSQSPLVSQSDIESWKARAARNKHTIQTEKCRHAHRKHGEGKFLAFKVERGERGVRDARVLDRVPRSRTRRFTDFDIHDEQGGFFF
jgi:hypothetical protein